MTRPVRVLSRTPGLLRLYGRALVPKRGGAHVPGLSLALDAAAADPERLARYRDVCGFTAQDRLPVTYPHLAAFPLSLELLTRRDFPFPLLGLVHIANRIDRLRPLRANECLSYRVWAERPYGHAKGTAFDVRAEARDGTGAVWRSDSTYLRRGPGGPGGERRAPTIDPRECDLAEPARERFWEVPASAGRVYGAVSGDRNPIHLSRATARLFGFRRAIAHGMWSKARCLAALADVLPDACRVETVFHSPVLLPSTVRFRGRPVDGGWAFALDGVAGRRHLRGRIAPL